jgi:alpha,alpha-trehalase
MYFDFDIGTLEQNPYEGVITFFPLWAGLASPEQAQSVVYVLDTLRADRLMDVQRRCSDEI